VAGRGPIAPGTRVGQVLAGLVPNPDLPMSIAVAPFAKPDGPGGSLALVVSAEPPASAADTNQQLTVQMNVFTPEGAQRGSNTMSIRLMPEPGADRVRVQAFGRFDLPPGSYRVRAAAYTPDRNLSGSVFSDVTIPDFAGARVSLSGLMIEAQPAVRSVPATLFAPFTSIMPTTERAFGRMAPVTGYVRVQQGGSDPLRQVRLAVVVLNAKDGVGFEKIETLEPSQFSPARTLDVTFQVPIGQLLVGPHLLRVTGSAGDARVHRDVRFSVK